MALDEQENKVCRGSVPGRLGEHSANIGDGIEDIELMSHLYLV